MKLLRFGTPGNEQPGMLDGNGRVRSLEGVVDDINGVTLSDENLKKISLLDPATLPEVSGDMRLGPCISGVGKIICVGLNYKSHAEESDVQLPPEPILFMKATSSIVGPNDDVVIPRGSEKTDWEVELAVVIGKTAKHVSEADALNYVGGYCVINDVSERAYQLERAGQWDKGKGCDTFAPLGPWLVTRDEVPDPQALNIWLEVDGTRHQDANTESMAFGVAHLVSYISDFMSLHPGDIISSGTPGGVGLGYDPPVYLKPGQTMRLGIDGLGEQQQRTVAYE